MENPVLRRLFSTFCRSVGPGGTEVKFVATQKGIEAIWTNENCPYSEGDEHDRAADRHNIDSAVKWEQLEEALNFAIKKKLFTPKLLKRNSHE